ncbi:MAG: S49 family peptidase [Planctomycetota bacterium]
MPESPKPELLQQAVSRFAGDAMAVEPGELAKHMERAARLGFAFDGPDELRVQVVDGVAVFYVDGLMVPEAEWPGEIGTRALAAAIREHAALPDVVAGVLALNTPGGTVAGMTDLLAAEREFAEAKPLAAHAVGWCCSAGYWAAMPAKALHASPGATLGSIGVMRQLLDNTKLLEQIGVRYETIATGDLKAIGYPGVAITEQHLAYAREQVEFTYAAFKGDVQGRRQLAAAQLAEVTTGGTWYAEQAIASRLHDGIQSLESTIAGAKPASSPVRSSTMAESAKTEPAAPQAATLKQLKEKFPTSTAEWREEQIEAAATLTDAAIDFANAQAERAAAAEKAAGDAKAEAEKAAARQSAKTEPKASTRGVVVSDSDPVAEADPMPTDYRAMAEEYMAKHKCRWSEACLAVKRKHSDSRASFGAPPTSYMDKYKD